MKNEDQTNSERIGSAILFYALLALFAFLVVGLMTVLVLVIIAHPVVFWISSIILALVLILVVCSMLPAP